MRSASGSRITNAQGAPATGAWATTSSPPGWASITTPALPASAAATPGHVLIAAAGEDCSLLGDNLARFIDQGIGSHRIRVGNIHEFCELQGGDRDGASSQPCWSGSGTVQTIRSAAVSTAMCVVAGVVATAVAAAVLAQGGRAGESAAHLPHARSPIRLAYAWTPAHAPPSPGASCSVRGASQSQRPLHRPGADFLRPPVPA